MSGFSTFDQWRKDVFFPAAEEVQESADTMESVYRMWIRECGDGFEPEFSVELIRELHITLGTAKWQLEEFERAASLSHENLPTEDNTITRHKDFIAAIRNKISHVEKAIDDSLLKEGKQPLRWVQLDEEERDEFENFLSMAPQSMQGNKGKYADHDSIRGIKGTERINNGAKHAVKVEAKEPTGDQKDVQVKEESFNGRRETGSLEDMGAWKIVIADEEDVDRKLVEARPEIQNRVSSLWDYLRSLESGAMLKLFRSSFGKVKSGEHLQPRSGVSKYLDLKRIGLFTQPPGINGLSERSRSCFSSCKESPKGSPLQQIVRVNGLQRHFQGSQSNKRPIQVTLLLVLTIFLIVPFVLYST